MRPLLLAVLLLSCAGDEARRAPAPTRADPPTAQPARAAESPTAQPARAAEPPRTAEAAPAVIAAREPAPDPRVEVRRAAHDALAENCGECHEGHRSTNAKALAVFDLDQPDWPTRFTPPRFESALRRLVKKSEPASAAFVAFRDAELAARPN
jgi:predicted CXXCH cytochrome family protein